MTGTLPAPTANPATSGPPDVDPAAAATAIRPLLTANRSDNDAGRRLADESVEALIDAGQFRTLVPRRFGGMEAPLSTVVESTSEVAAGDPAAGWVVMILSCGDWLVGLFDERAQADVYAGGPDTRVCSVFNPTATSVRVDGGWIVDGRWAPSSGCRHAQWAMLGVPLADDPASGGATVHGFALIPMGELTVVDTWRTLGMRATASDTLHGGGMFVPDHRLLRVGPALAGDHPAAAGDSARYRSAVMSTLCTHMMAPYLGMAGAALAYVTGTAPSRKVTFTCYERQTDSTAFVTGVAEAAMKIDSAWALAHRAASDVDRAAEARIRPSEADRARIRGWTGHVVTQCREAVDLLVSHHGTAALVDGSPLEQIVRDMHTSSRHAIANPIANTEIYGRALLGLCPNISPMI